MRKLTILLFFIITFTSSCNKIDYREAYVGTYINLDNNNLKTNVYSIDSLENHNLYIDIVGFVYLDKSGTFRNLNNSGFFHKDTLLYPQIPFSINKKWIKK